MNHVVPTKLFLIFIVKYYLLLVRLIADDWRDDPILDLNTAIEVKKWLGTTNILHELLATAIPITKDMMIIKFMHSSRLQNGIDCRYITQKFLEENYVTV
jgi:hypothetical protein